VTSFEKGGLRPGMEELSAKFREESQRFFDTYRPAIKRKYGACLLRWEALDLTPSNIVPQCAEKLVIISGAEPLEQNLDDLIVSLRNAGHTIQVETSGVFEFKGKERPDILVCSPKPNVNYGISSSVLESVTAVKMVNGPQGSGLDWNPQLAQTLHDLGKKVFIMPYGQPPSKKSIQEAAQLALDGGYSFSPRLHYILGVR
jgi:organic radical activating enzyme